MFEHFIVVVDNSPIMWRFIDNTLKKEGFSNVKYFDNVWDALDGMQKQVKSPDLIITSWHMPKAGGDILTAEVRNKFKWTQTQILMVATESAKNDILQGLKSGVNNYILKPFTPEELIAKTYQLLGINQDY